MLLALGSVDILTIFFQCVNMVVFPFVSLLISFFFNFQIFLFISLDYPTCLVPS